MERVPEAKGAGETDEFAALLREFKDRSGLSYGALAKRLHMSTSTLHRYCNGTALPNEYAPAERLARVCRATPDELVQLHRRWILADAARRGRPETPPVPPPAKPGEAGETADAADEATSSSPSLPDAPGEPIVAGAPPASAPSVPPRRRRTALIASVAAAAALGAVLLAVTVPFGGDDGQDRRAAGATAAPTGRPDTTTPPAKDSASPSPTGTRPKPSGSASTGASAGTGRGASKSGGGPAAPGGEAAAVPLNVAIRPFVYDSPCSQHFLVDSEPEQVGPPAGEQDAPRWAAAYGAVSSGEQWVALTVQGAGRGTVVLNALHVRVVTKGAPLAWNDYSMGVGCGGGVETKSFDIDLDDGSPTVTPKSGQRDFPYKVSESDPEVFYVTAHTKAHDVRWDLSLDWSSGVRRGTVHIDSDGTPFRTSARAGRPGYDYPLGGSEWIERIG